MMVGNYEHAAKALHMYLTRDYSAVLSAGGTTRMVYLIDGIVYKVEGPGQWNVNEIEYETITTMTLPDGFYFPNVSLHRVGNTNVIAMDYVEGTAIVECFCSEQEFCDETCAPSEVIAVMDKLGLDSGGFNVIVTDRGYCIIDAH